MKFPAKIFGPPPAVLATAIFIFAFSAFGQTPRPAGDNSAGKHELNMLVLGDSILWGQGLKQEHKSWYLVKTWLEQMNGSQVSEKVHAHAGAVIGAAGTSPSRSLNLHGEINSGWPTLHDQIDEALTSFADPAQADLVLVNGCINDVNARRFLNAANAPEEIQALAREKCGVPVEGLLSKIASSFPNAHIIISGYYPVVSDKTPRDLFMRALAKRYYAPAEPTRRRPSDKELLERLTIVSNAWYEASNNSLTQSVTNVNSRLALQGSRQRVLFAKILFLPEHAFAARDSRLWGFDASLLGKLLAVFTLGRVSLRANDEVRSLRAAVCRDFFKPIPGETKEQKRARNDQLLVCRLAAIAHPNRKGAVIYAEAMKQQLQALLLNPGWLRTATIGPASP